MSSTRRQIEIAALRLLEKDGAGAVSMRRVAQAVGLTPMAIYHHFKNRAELLDRVVATEFSALEEAMTSKRLTGSLERRIMAALDIYVLYALERPRVFDYLFSEARSGARRYPEDFRAGRSPTLNRFASLLAEGIAAGELRSGDRWELAMHLWAQVHGFVMLFRAGRFDLTQPEFINLVRRSIKRLLHGLAVPDSRAAR